MKNDFKQLVDRDLSGLRWDEARQARVLAALEPKGGTTMNNKMRLVLAFALVLLMMASVAMAAVMAFSPRYDALQLADQALLEKYGITEAMHPALIHTISENGNKTIITYDVVEWTSLRENRFGTYTVTVVDGKAEAMWSMDGMETSGGLDAPAWGAEQLLMYVQEWGEVYQYMEPRNMLINPPFDEELFWQQEKKWEQDKQTALSMAQITLAEAVSVGRDAIAMRFHLNAGQIAMLERSTGSDDESTYEMVDGRPQVNLFFYLTQNPGEWTDKDGIYVVTINLLDGAVEDIYYDNGLMGNG